MKYLNLLYYLMTMAFLTFALSKECPKSSHEIEPVLHIDNMLSLELSGNKKFIAAHDYMVDYFSDLEERRRNDNEITNEPRSCDDGDTDINSLDKVLNFTGFGELEEKCRTSIFFSQRSKKGRFQKSQKLFGHMDTIANEMESAGRRLLDKSDIDFPGDGVYSNFKFGRPNVEVVSKKGCNLRFTRSSAYRVGGKWYMAAVFTNYPVHFEVAGNDRRLFYTQLLEKKSNGFDYVPFQFRNCTEEGELTSAFSAPAYILRRKRQGVSQYFKDNELDDVPAVRAALASGDDILEEFEDFDTASDVAIFILPVVLALIPISLFQDVNGKLGLAYVIFIDILSAIPIGLKSVELITKSSLSYSSGGFLYGGKNTAAIGAAEFWVAQCKVPDGFRSRGIGLLIFTLITIFVAVALDVFVTSQLLKYKKDYKSQLEQIEEPSSHTYPNPSYGLLWYLNKSNWPEQVTDFSH